MSADFSGYDFALIAAKGLGNSEMAFLKNHFSFISDESKRETKVQTNSVL